MQIPAPFEYLRTPVMDTALAGGHSPLPPMKLRPTRPEGMPTSTTPTNSANSAQRPVATDAPRAVRQRGGLSVRQGGRAGRRQQRAAEEAGRARLRRPPGDPGVSRARREPGADLRCAVGPGRRARRGPPPAAAGRSGSLHARPSGVVRPGGPVQLPGRRRHAVRAVLQGRHDAGGAGRVASRTSSTATTGTAGWWPRKPGRDRTGVRWSAPGSSSRSTTSPIRGGSGPPPSN